MHPGVTRALAVGAIAAIVLAGLAAAVVFRFQLRDQHRLVGSMSAQFERQVAERTAALHAEIEARRQAEQALRSARLLMEKTVGNAPVGIIVLDEDFRVRLVNDQFRLQYGAVADAIDVGSPFEDFMRALIERESARSPGQEAQISALIRSRIASLRRGEDAEFESVGSSLKINRRHVPGFGTVITNVDISELKEAEKKIEEARRLLHATVENAPAGILLVDEDLRVRIANDWYRQTYGIAGDDPLIGQRYDELVARLMTRRFTGSPTHDREVRAEIAHRIDDIVNKRNGDLVDDLSNGMTVKLTRRHAEGVGFVVTIVDISDVRRAEAALREQRRLLDATIENAPVGIVVLDEELRVHLVNSEFKQQHGNVADALVPGAPFDAFLRGVFARELANAPERARDIEAVFETRLASLRARASVVYEGIGTNIKINRRYVPGFGTVITNVDISEQKKVEADLRHALDELGRTQGELIEREKLAALGGLVAGLSHEINTPIGVCVTASSHVAELSGRLRTALAAPGGGSPAPEVARLLDRVDEATAIIGRNIERASGLVRSFKQVAVDQTADDERSIELGAYVADVVHSLAAETRRANLRIAVDAGDRPIVCYTNPGAIAQILTNLVINAIVHAYKPGEGGRMEIALAEDAADHVALTVRDFGKGMNAATRARVFEPFFTTRRGRGGTGLGLHIAYNLATRSLGGSLQCRSEPGASTEFVLRMPRNIGRATGDGAHTVQA
jgi:signal transduction histidine kinase